MNFVVGNYTAERLLRPAVRRAGKGSIAIKPRHEHVQDLFDVSEEHAIKLCRTFGISPNEPVGGVEDDGPTAVDWLPV